MASELTYTITVTRWLIFKIACRQLWRRIWRQRPNVILDEFAYHEPKDRL